MLAVTEEVKKLYQADSIPKSLLVNFYQAGTYLTHPASTIFPSDSLYPNSRGVPLFAITEQQVLSESMSITEGLFSGDVINFQSCYSSKCSLTILDVETDVHGFDMEVIQMIGEEQIPLFTGVVDEAKQRDNKTNIVAYDYLYYNYNEDMSAWYNSLKFPMTVKEFRLALYSVCDIPFADIDLANDHMTLEKAELGGEVTGRQFLAMIGEMNGAFVHVNRYNELTYIMLQWMAYIYPGAAQFPRIVFPGIQTGIEKVEKIESYISCEYERFKTKDINRVILNGEDILESGEGDNAYVIDDNLLFNSVAAGQKQEALDNLFQVIHGLPYVPHKTEIKGRPYVEVGDVINIKTKWTAFDTYVFMRTLKGVKALRDTYEAEGEEYHNTAYRV